MNKQRPSEVCESKHDLKFIFQVHFPLFQLPVHMFESVIDLVNGQATMLFVELHFTLATEEAERIGVDHVARVTNSETMESSVGE